MKPAALDSTLLRLAMIALGGVALFPSLVVATCPPGVSVPITSGTGEAGIPLVFSFHSSPGGNSLFVLGAGDENHIGASLVSLGDLDGDGRIEYRLEVPGTGPGSWGDEAARGCPATVPSPYPPLVLFSVSPFDDWDGDALWDVFEDRNHNGFLDLGEDLDGDGRLTPRIRFTAFGNFPGCEGSTREDVDCDGHLDLVNEDLNSNDLFDPGEDRDDDRRLDDINEDRNGNGSLDFFDQDANGRFDAGEPTEDTNLNGRLDTGIYIEDRNFDRVLNDRPAPAPDDQIFFVALDGTRQTLAPDYPYQRLRPLVGGVLLASVAWNGSAYDFDAIDTPTRLITLADGRQFRAVDQQPVGTLVPHISAVRLERDSDFGYRMHIDPIPAGRVDDVGGRRVIFDSYVVDLLLEGPHLCEIFLETGDRSATVGPEGGFLSIVSECLPDLFDVRQALQVVPRSTGSDSQIDWSGWFPRPRLRPSIFDRDRDFFSLPYDLCPDVPSSEFAFEPDSNRDGLGDGCDPAANALAPIDAAWDFRPDADGPGFRPGAAAAYDEGRRVVVLFGGSDDAVTWEYDGASWTRVPTASAPSPRTGHRMVYDGAHARILLFGGVTGTDERPNDLWAYDGRDWTRVETRGSPPPSGFVGYFFGLTDFGLAWDEARNVLVLFHSLGQTWILGEDRLWRRVTTSRSPSPRIGIQMAYDPERQVTVIEGGREFPASAQMPQLPINDTWEFDGISWQEVDARGDLTPSYAGAMAYDRTRRTMVNFGGFLIGEYLAGGGAPFLIQIDSAATRLYDGSTWSYLPSRPTVPPQVSPAIAYDSARRTLVVHGQNHAAGESGLTAELRLPEDADRDRVPDQDDNCPGRANPDQADFDHDGRGDACDNCLEIPNPTQRDLDSEGRGDDCDDDRDGDGVANTTDACPSDYVAGRAQASVLGGGGPDSDGDGTPDDCDRCPGDRDDDRDRDGICGDADNCPTVFNPHQEDATHDGSGDACQPVLVLEGVIQDGGDNLEVLAYAADPNGDPLRGSIAFFPIEEISLRAVDFEDPAGFCASDTYPPAVPGTGIAYISDETVGQFLTDLDSGAACVDGGIDYVISTGPCDAGFGFGISHYLGQLPQAICVAPYYGPDPGNPPPETRIDLTIVRADATSLIFFKAGTTPALTIPFSDGLPDIASIAGLADDAHHRMVIEVSDGNSLPVRAETTFLHQSERVMVIPRAGPTANIRPPAPAECGGPAGGLVTLDGSASTAGDGTGNGLTHAWYEDFGQPEERLIGEGAIMQILLPLGDHAIVLRVTDAGGRSDLARATALVQDTVAPTLVLATTPPALWPPNHRMVPVQISWEGHDACDPNPALRLLSVTSNEADDAAADEDGRTTGDIVGADLGTPDTEILLRAERLGGGSGRTYEIAGEVVDASGHRSPALAVVSVPHDLGSGADPVALRFAAGSGTGSLDLVWSPAPGATRYDVAFGALGTLRFQRNRTTLIATREIQLPSTQASIADPSDPAGPAAGGAWFYLVQYHDDRGPTGYGTAGAPWPIEMILPDP